MGTPQAVQQASGFNSTTRQSWIQGNPVNFSANSTNSQQLPPVGFLSRIILQHNLQITTGSTGTYANTIADPPTPYGFIKRIRVYTNEGQEIWNTSGYGAYLHERIINQAIDPRNVIASFNSVNTAVAVYNIPATYTTSSPYTITWYSYLDIAWEQSLLAGLIFLQNPTNRITLEITQGDGTTILTTGGTTPSVTVNSYTCTPLIEVFQLPQDQSNWPSLTYSHQVIEDQTNPISGTGDVLYQPLIGNTYLSIVTSWINNGAPMVPANFSGIRVSYQGTQTSYVATIAQQLIMQRTRYGIDLPDGVFAHDYRFGTGLSEVGNTRDAINTSELTSFQIITTISSGVSLVTPNYRGVREMLANLVSSSGQ